MKTFQFVLAALIAATAADSIAQAQYALNITADRENSIYKAGEEARFHVSVAQGKEAIKKGSVSYILDDFITEYPPADSVESGAIDLSGDRVIVVKSKNPGFIRCRVAFVTPDKKRLTATCGIGFSPLEISTSLPVPDDFDSFWADQKKQLAAVKMETKFTPVKNSNDSIELFDVQITCLGAPVSGYFGKPKDAKPKSLPAVLWVHGAGVRSSNLPNAVNGATNGMLSMDINAHGIPNGQPGKFYKEQNDGPLKNYRFVGREKRETSYFRGMYLRLVRAIDFLTSQPEWDGKVVAVIGHSQGGGQALVAGGIDDRVTLIATGVPAICDHSGRAAGRINGWPKLVPTANNRKPDPVILQASRYVDAVNFASRCKADAIMSVGFIDAVCPPSSCYAAYNQLQGKKQIMNEPTMGHAAPAHIKTAFFERILEHVRKSKKK
jgi:cephalosporin-C deacetylase